MRPMQRHFDEQLQELKERLLAMGGLAETMIAKSVKALVERSEALVQEVFAHEEEMDRHCIDTDDRCFTLLALHQPMAGDLRFIAVAIKINSDIERIGDLAVNIAQATMSLITEPQLKPLVDIPRMARLCQEMVKKSLDAFVAQDPELARIVIESDDAVDLLREQVFRDLLNCMIDNSATVPRAMDLILVSRCLERIADHATNIAEDVVYIVRGEDVRERGDKEIRKGIRRQTAAVPLISEADRKAVLAAHRLMPEEREFLTLIESAARNLLEAAGALQTMFDNYTNPEAQWRKIRDVEHQGDAITHRIMKKLNQTFIPFIDRQELRALTSTIDDVVDFIEAAASRMVLYHIAQPTPQSREMVALITASAEQIVKAIGHLPTFAGVDEICVEINRLENLADDLYRHAIASLFEGDRPILDVTKWKEIYELLEGVTDRCEDVANVVETIALKHS
ncbi:PhoU family transcriptional regulator [Candidatus Methylomirabilis lanthanidiphila]|uniref:PhoU family transcriptional regulator n=1 Tax=Candidatus Methylomirabilis lanthanidiphila TaxID=2211376 RepID=A0A564ZNX3_9BACT|nr:phosphate signaling complex protein PhoU [Candidatus Methylomirabilis lanthanidiphila]VUZ86258.1 PhoU family transcriptional regulator [Candidatus Methylomirabilis lanthanidiphila]